LSFGKQQYNTKKKVKLQLITLHLTSTMVVRLRLARFGRRNLPYYSIVAANAKTARNAKPLETIGTYNPIPDGQGIKHVNLNIERVKYWLTVGAQPSETVERLLSKVLDKILCFHIYNIAVCRPSVHVSYCATYSSTLY
jgi:small subunit ribosomal protein S16